jgi:NDP-sugar pyrophosphorylase family protein
MEFSVLEGFWSDAGTFESLLRASVMVQEIMPSVWGRVAGQGSTDLSSMSGDVDSGIRE